MTLRQLLLILAARYRIILLAVVCTTLAALAVCLALPKKYVATASVLIDVRSPDPVAGTALPAMTLPGYMATQVDIIASNRVAERVIRSLGMDKDPVLQEKWLEETGGDGSFPSWYGNALRGRLEVKPQRDSNVVKIAFTASDPRQAARIANAFAQGYIDTNVDLRAEPARQYARWFEQQGGALREQLEQAQARLATYQQQHGIIATGERLDFESQKLNELQTQVVLAQTANADARSKQTSGDLDTNQETMQNPTVLQLRGEIAMQQAKMKEAAGRLGVNHPQYRSMQAGIDELRQKLSAEVRRIQSSIDTSRRVNSEKVSQLKAAIESQKRSILGLRTQMDEVAMLRRDVDAAQKAYDTVSTRLNQSNLESKSTQTNISVLTAADAPAHPSSPRILLSTAAAALVGLALGIAAALFLELRNRRVLSAEDIEYLGMPVLATVPASTGARRLPGRSPLLPAAAIHQGRG